MLALALAAGAALWWAQRGGPAAEAPAAEQAPRASEPAAPGASDAPPEALPSALPVAALPEAAEALPALAESDALARRVGAALSSSPLVAAALREAGVIERFVAAVDLLAEGKVPRRDLDFLRPKEPFRAAGREPELRVDPRSYRRYDALVAAVAALDAGSVAAAYRRLAPLCEEAYRALGYPEGGFEARLRAALALLSATPRTEAAPALVAQVKRYEFADPRLEQLADAQKLLLRMGPEHAALVASKLRAIEAALPGPAAEAR